MNKLDYIDMQLDGNGKLKEIFERMGALEFQSELESVENSVENSELKTTSVRLPSTLLDSLDAVNRRFEITRQDAFTYMVADYIANSVSNYVFGRVKSMVRNGIQCENIVNLYNEEFDALITSMPCSDDIKENIKRLAYAYSVEYMNDLGGV